MQTHASAIDQQLLASVGFTDHAVQRFAERAGFATARRDLIEPVMRDLLLQEGRIVAQRPRWARSRNEADLYLQVGEWLLFVCRASRRRLGSFDVVTVVNGPQGTTWAVALQRGFLLTPLPLDAARPRRRRVGWGESFKAGRAAGGEGGLLRAILHARRELRRARDAEHAAALAADAAARRRHAEQRAHAHEQHLRRHG